jgi:hypothetical protein
VLAQTALAQPPGGSGGAGGSSRPTWVTPVCLRVGGPRGEATICALAGGPTAELKLPFCPAWLWSNAGGAGYYVSALPPRDLPALWPRLTAEERLALAVDAALLARRGALPLDDALALLGPLARDPDPRQTGAALLLAGLLEPRTLPTAELGRWRAFLRRTFGARARALGWLPRPDDGPATQPLRAALLPLVAGEGEEAVLAGEALALARRWLADRRQVPAEVAWPALRAAAYHGDQALFDQVLAQAGQAGTAEPHGTAEPRGPEERARLTALLGRFKEPGPAAAALRLALDPATAPGDAAGLLAEALSGRETRPAAVSALAGGWAGLQARLSEEEEARLVDALARPACQPADRAAVVALLGAAPGRAGGLRALALGLEEADACGAARGRQAQAVVRFLSRG